MNGIAGKPFGLEIADVARQIYSGPCVRVIAPAAQGEVGILHGHTPFLTRLIPGQIRVRTEDGEDKVFFVSGGYMEVQPGSVTVLADQILRTEEIDRDAAEKSRKQAEAVLKKSPLFRERDEAYLQLAKAIAQLRVLEYAERVRRGGRR